jgi:NTP pyrophosphatase (non-canonical NTP hydrolase)
VEERVKRMTEKRSLYEMQEEVDAYIQQFKAGYFSPLAQMARLTEEVGELAREINHHYGEKAKKTTEVEKTVAEELGDVLFVTMIMANSLGIDLTEVFEANMEKFNRRDAYRFERKDGKTNEAD